MNRASFGYWGVVLAVLLWRALSLLPVRAHWLLGGALGEILHLLARHRGEIASRNLQLCFPEHDERWRQRLLRAHFRQVGRAIFSAGVGAWGSSRRIDRVVDFDGLDTVRVLLDQKQPVILLSPHFVDVIFLALALSHTLAMATMYKAPRNEVFHAIYRRACTGESTGDRVLDWISATRRERYLGIVEHRQASLHGAVRALRRLTPFLYLPDQDLGRRHTVFAPFFGTPANSSVAICRFVELSHAKVVPVYVTHKPSGAGFTIHFDAPLEPFPGGDDVADATAINRAIEELVRRHPANYFWLHKRFKTRPKGEPPIY